MNYLVLGDDERMNYVRASLADKKNEKLCIITPPNLKLDSNFVWNKILAFNDFVLVYGKMDDETKRMLSGYETHCLLSDEIFTMGNAKLTALAAIDLLSKTDLAPYDLKLLLIGFGRIGSAFARYFTALGGKLDIATSSVRQAGAFADKIVDMDKIDFNGYDVIVNTSPKLSDVNFKSHKYGALYIDLAGKDVLPLAELSASGIDAKYYPAMPAKFYPKSAGKLICDFIFREGL